MKRFYKTAAAEHSDLGWAITLDTRPVKTPARKPLVVPTQMLGDAIAAEWQGQDKEIDPRSMPLNGLANAAIDRVASDVPTFAAQLAHYGETDLLCYRADSPAELVAQQCAAWDPLLAWATEHFEIAFETTDSIVHRPQPEQTVARLGEVLSKLDAWHLAGLSPLVTIGGSLVGALALSERAFEEDEVWTATQIDESWQQNRWGEDEEAIAARDEKRREFGAAMRFLRLLDA